MEARPENPGRVVFVVRERRGAGGKAMSDRTLGQVEERLGYSFKDRGRLELALTHASVAESRVRSNERMEFLGDAVLGLVVCRRIYEKYPDLLEGEMTKIKSAVVSRQSCAQMAGELGLTGHLVLGKGMKTHEVLPLSLGAAALEAVVAAVFLDGGLEPVQRLLLPLLEVRLEKAFDSGHHENYKSILQQHAQQTLGGSPAYVVLAQRGPDHAKEFHICVQVGDKRFEPSWGASKKAAEQQAAYNALSALGLMAPDDAGVVRLVNGGNGGGNGRHANGNGAAK